MKKISDVTEQFYQTVVEVLENALARQREKDPKANSALVDIDVVPALIACGADSVDIRVNVAAGTKDNNKGDKFTFVTVVPYADGLSERIEFSQRHQARKAEVKAMETLIASNTKLTGAKCLAGLTVVTGPENRIEKHWSFKWESLSIDDENGIEYSGPVRKWHEDTRSYDVPVID